MESDRDEDLEQIRRTYADYRESREGLWDASNPGYARLVRDRDKALVALLRSALAANPKARILDVGCGPATLAVAARAVGVEASWTGVDLLAESIEAASRHAPFGTWVQASADQLPFGASSFEMAVASTLFSSLPSRDLEVAAANEVARVLSPGGWLIWYDLRYDNPTNPAVHGIGRSGLRRLFPGWSMELRSITLLPPLARRLGFTVPVAYPVLEAIPLLRSHLVGRLWRP